MPSMAHLMNAISLLNPNGFIFSRRIKAALGRLMAEEFYEEPRKDLH